MSTELRPPVWALLLLLVTAVTFAPLAGAGFVWDDKPLVVDNTVTHTLANLPLFFQVDLWETAGGVESASGYYRPLVLLSLALDRALWGLSPMGHHLHSVAWHLLAVGLLWGLLQELARPQAALVGAALFALHPVQVEAVAWVAARNDLMVAAFVFGSVLALRRQRLLLGGLLALAALLSKESGVFAVVLLFAVEGGRPSPRQVAPLVGAGLAWLLLRNGVAHVGGASMPDAVGLFFLVERLPQIAAHYGRLLILGFPLSTGATLEYLNDGWPSVLLGLAAVGGLFALCARRGGRIAWGALLFAVLSLAPAVLAIAVRGQLGERYLYLPLAGVALAVASALPERRGVLAVAGPVLLLWVGLVHRRLPDWADDLGLFTAAVQTTPNGFSYASLGHELNIRSEGPEACVLFRRALLEDPPYIDVCSNAVRCGLKRGNLNEAALGARLTEDRCPRTESQVGLEGLTWLQTCDIAGARRVTDGFEPSLDARLPLVLAVLAVRDGDDEAYATIEAMVPEPASFSLQVQQLHGMCP